MAQSSRIRVLVAKAGLDGHDRGAKVVARGLRDAGMEVIYTGLYKTPGQIVDIAIQEDVDVIGLSILHGAHETLVAEVLEHLGKNEIKDIMVLVGGIIPGDDAARLKSLGVSEVFGPETSTKVIADYIRVNLKTK